MNLTNQKKNRNESWQTLKVVKSAFSELHKQLYKHIDLIFFAEATINDCDIVS